VRGAGDRQRGRGRAGALADTIASLLGDGARWEELAAAARRTAAERFGIEACGRATVDAYREALSR